MTSSCIVRCVSFAETWDRQPQRAVDCDDQKTLSWAQLQAPGKSAVKVVAGCVDNFENELGNTALSLQHQILCEHDLKNAAQFVLAYASKCFYSLTLLNTVSWLCTYLLHTQSYPLMFRVGYHLCFFQYRCEIDSLKLFSHLWHNCLVQCLGSFAPSLVSFQISVGVLCLGMLAYCTQS